MTNSWHGNFADFRDIENVDFYNQNKDTLREEELFAKLNFGSRDNARRPVAWNGEKYGGFSTVKPWIPVYSKYKEINLEKDKNSEKSIFAFYKKLLAFRKSSPTVLYGDYREITGENKSCYIYERNYEDEKLVIVCNFEKENTIRLSYPNGELLLSNYSPSRPLNGAYAPYELAVFRIE